MNTLPQYQKKHVEDYFAYVKGKSSAPIEGYALGGRGYPDISAAANNFNIVNGGELLPVSGTSASAPVVAAMISLVNAARFKAGAKPLGWVHPAMYEGYKSFVNDITVGKNNCTNAYHPCCPQGYEATPGWDPSTGLGTLNFRKFKTYMMDIQAGGSRAGPPTGKPSPLPSFIPTASAPSPISGKPPLSPISPSTSTSLPSSRTPTTNFPSSSTPSTESPQSSRPTTINPSTALPTKATVSTTQPTTFDPPSAKPTRIPTRLPTKAAPRSPPTRAPVMPRAPFGTGPHPRKPTKQPTP